MNLKSLFFTCCFLIVFPFGIKAQKQLSETDQLTFQTAFFEALKQKAIDNYDKALEALDVCYGLDSTNVAVLFERSKNFFWQKNYSDAEQNINKALKLKPKNIWLLEQAKAIAVAQQNYEDAITYQKQIVAIDSLKKIELLVLYMANKDKTKAMALLIDLKKTQGLNPQLLQIEAQLKTPQTKVETTVNSDSKTDLKSLKATYQKSHNFKVLKQILSLEAEQKNYELLNKDATDALELFPSQAVLYLYAAQANNALKQYQTAIDHLENGIDFVVDNVLKKQYFWAYFESYNGLNNPQKANDYKKRASQL
jgi:tetratricopeptide (TPR) repeat protein